MRAATAAAALLAAPHGAAAAAVDSCSDGIACVPLDAGGLTFDCRVAGDASDKPGVVLLHGFPEWSEMYAPLMRRLAGAGYRSVACNQRGYSPGASPDGVANYNYDVLRDDVLRVAAAANFSRFHLVGHDHGAALGWVVASDARVASYSSLSIPHIDAFSAGLAGPGADMQQVVASQYFTVFVLNNSASIRAAALYDAMGSSKDSHYGGFADAAAFQKAVWWYNGARDAGRMAIPRSLTAAELLTHGAEGVAMAGLRTLYGGGGAPEAPQARPIGNVSVPSLYVCGSGDTAILCNRPYALRTPAYIAPGVAYAYVEADCGHDLLSCAKASETTKVEDAILANIAAADAH